MANQTISYNIGSNPTFTNAECVSSSFELINNVLRTCILTLDILGNISYLLSTTVSTGNDPGFYNGETLVNVTANITDVGGNPVTVSWDGTTPFLTWSSPTPDFGQICGYTITTNVKTYTLDQACYDFTSMVFTPNNGSTTEDCNETQVVIS